MSETELRAALIEARCAINSMKAEAEAAGAGGDEQMLQDACETISNEGLAASMAIDAALAAAPAQPVAVPAEPVAQVTVSDDDLDMGFSESFISGEIRLPNGTHGLFTAGQMLAYVAADRAARGTAQAANVAGLESAVAHLSCLLDAFRALLVEVDDVCGRDGFDRVLADGESEVIDKIRAALAMTNAAPQPAAQAGELAKPSSTAGMSTAQRILHVGGRNNAAGYVEFGSTQAVDALVCQVLRDRAATWRPIATAPIDGKKILLRSKRGRIADGLWSAANSSAGFWTWAYVCQEPIEWMPLPASPAAIAAQQGGANG